MITELKRQLEMVVQLRKRCCPEALLYNSIEDFILRKGRIFKYAATPYHPIPRACFNRSFDHATRRNSKWIYCEGYALNPRVGLAVHHAWLTCADNPSGAYETAWPDVDGIYLGLAFQVPYVRKVHRASGRQMYSVLDAYWLDFPLLTGKQDLEEVIWKGQTR